MMTKAAAIITTIAINGGLNSTGNFDGGDEADDEVDVDWSVLVDCKKAAAVGDGDGDGVGDGDGNGNHRESCL